MLGAKQVLSAPSSHTFDIMDAFMVQSMALGGTEPSVVPCPNSTPPATGRLGSGGVVFVEAKRSHKSIIGYHRVSGKVFKLNTKS